MQPVKPWTIMVYLAADNNLANFGVGCLRLLKRAAHDNINVIAEFDTGLTNPNRRYAFGGYDPFGSINNDLTEAFGPTDASDSDNLLNFIMWGAANYPADHYFVSIWGHGCGVDSDFPRAPDDSFIFRHKPLSPFDLIGAEERLSAVHFKGVLGDPVHGIFADHLEAIIGNHLDEIIDGSINSLHRAVFNALKRGTSLALEKQSLDNIEQAVLSGFTEHGFGKRQMRCLKKMCDELLKALRADTFADLQNSALRSASWRISHALRNGIIAALDQLQPLVIETLRKGKLPIAAKRIRDLMEQNILLCLRRGIVEILQTGILDIKQNSRSRQINSLSFADHPMSFLTNAGLPEALATASQRIGQNIDILAIDSCNMNMIEIGYGLRNSVNFLVASQDGIPDASLPYDKVIAKLASAPSVDPTRLASITCETFLAAYEDYTDKPDVTLSVLDLKRSGSIVPSFRNFVTTLMKASTRFTGRNAVAQARNHTRSFGANEFIDLLQFCNLVTCAPDLDLARAASDLITPLRAMIPANAPSTGEHSCNGTSIYFPQFDAQQIDHTRRLGRLYSKTDLVRATGWGKFISGFLELGKEELLVKQALVSAPFRWKTADGTTDAFSDKRSTRQKGHARFVNVSITEGSTHRLVPKSSSLKPSGKYALQLNIGPWLHSSGVKNPIPVPTENLPPTKEGHWLEVIAVSDDFRLKHRRYHIFLPKVGASFVCSCKPGGSHTCSASHRQLDLFIPIVAPSMDHAAVNRAVSARSHMRRGAVSRLARLRLALYFEKNLVQSLLLTANVRLVGRPGRGYGVRIDYSLTSHLSDFSFLTKRTLNILTNDNADKGHKLIINGEFGNAISFNLTEGKMASAIAAARQTLKEISVKEYGGKWGAEVQYENRYDTNNAKSKDDFIADLRLLAPLGWKLWATLFQAQPEARNKISATLRETHIRPATIQVSRIEGSALMFPWSFIYDIPLETDTRKHVLCESLRTWDVNGKEVPERCPFEQKHRKKNVICPFGFWGFNHVIEQPPSMPLGRALPTLIKRSEAHAKAHLVMCISLDLDSGVTRAHMNSLRQNLAAFELIPKDSRNEVEEALAQDELEMVYFYCHGRRESLAGSKTTTPYIEVGNKEGIAPGDIIAWQSADWNEVHWKRISPLVFINGCHTAELTPELLVDFVDSFIGVYAAGVIGTEILLLQEVASEAAEQVLLVMNNNKKKEDGGEYYSVGQAMRKMRLHFLGKGNLLGLAYTPYCSAGLRLAN